jgi:heptosyltransferase-3
MLRIEHIKHAKDMERRIFIHHDGALGDLLLSLPAIQALREPGDLIYLAGRWDVVDFLKKVGYIRHGFRAGSDVFLPLFTGEQDRGIEEFISGFDKVYVFSTDKSSHFAARICLLFPCAEILITIPPPESRMHVSDFRRKQVAPKREGDISACRLMIPPALQEEARTVLLKCGYDFRRRLVSIHPGSGSGKKCWPLRNFKDLIKNLRKRDNCFFLIFSGPAESGKMQEEITDYLRGQEKNCLYIAGHDLTTVASLLSLSHLYIGNDSGITHLASSVMTGRVIALFGPTDPRIWGPRANVASIISSDMECAPCETNISGSRFHRRSEGCGIKCLSGITVQRVTEAFEFQRFYRDANDLSVKRGISGMSAISALIE